MMAVLPLPYPNLAAIPPPSRALHRPGSTHPPRQRLRRTLRKRRPPLQERMQNPRASGMIANLQPGDCRDLQDLRETPAFHRYRSRLRRLVESRKTDYAAGFASALHEAGAHDLRLREAPADIRLTSVRARMIDNADRDDVIEDPLGWSRRRAAKGKLHVILLPDVRSLC